MDDADGVSRRGRTIAYRRPGAQMQRARAGTIARTATVAVVPPLVALVLQVSFWPEAESYRWILTLTAWLGGAWLGVAVAGFFLGDRWTTLSWRPRKTRRIRQALAETNAELNRA